MGHNEKKFFEVFASGDAEKRIVLEMGASEGPDGFSPFIVIRHKGMTMVLNPQGFDDHMCVDVHSFVDGKDATAGVFGMTEGYRYTLEGAPPTTSHKWPSAEMVTVLLGEQGRAK